MFAKFRVLFNEGMTPEYICVKLNITEEQYEELLGEYGRRLIEEGDWIF